MAINKWEKIYTALRLIREDIKEAMMSGYGPEDVSHCGDVWDELGEQMGFMDQFHGDNSDAFVRELIRQAMIEEELEEMEGKFIND